MTAPRVVANVTLADNLGSLDSGLGAVWIADTAKGQILRLDPRSRQVRARIPVGGEAVVTVGAGAGLGAQRARTAAADRPRHQPGDRRAWRSASPTATC